MLCLCLQTIPVAMAGLRNAHGLCPPDVLKFLFDLIKYNDNSKNRYSDNYYRAALIDALSATITPVISLSEQGLVFYIIFCFLLEVFVTYYCISMRYLSAYNPSIIQFLLFILLLLF